MPSDPFDKLEAEHEDVAQAFEIVFRRARGDKVPDIAVAMYPQMDKGAAVRNVYAVIRKAISRINTSMDEIVKERFLVAAERLDALWRMLQKRIDQLTAEGEYSSELVKAAISVIDREGKLYGFDQVQDDGPRRGKDTDWLGEMGTTEATKLLKDYGINIPEPF